MNSTIKQNNKTEEYSMDGWTNCFQIWRVAANVLSKQSWTAEKV